MTLLAVEGVDTDLGLIVPGNYGSYDATAGRRGGGAYRHAHNSTSFVGLFSAGALSVARTYVFGVAVRVETLPASTTTFLRATTYNLLSLAPDGSVVITSANSQRFASASGLISVGSWTYLEWKLKIADSGGISELRANGTLVGTYSGDTRLSQDDWPYSGLHLFGPASNNSQYAYFDDFYVLDDLGTVNNDYLGDTAVVGLAPNGNGTHSEMTGSDGDSIDNHLLVADSDDATYVQSSAADQRDTYTMADLPFTGGTVRGVQLHRRSQRTQPGLVGERTIRRLGATEVYGTQVNAQMGFASRREVMETDPDGNPWSISNVNSAEFGVQARAAA